MRSLQGHERFAVPPGYNQPAAPQRVVQLCNAGGWKNRSTPPVLFTPQRPQRLTCLQLFQHPSTSDNFSLNVHSISRCVHTDAEKYFLPSNNLDPKNSRLIAVRQCPLFKNRKIFDPTGFNSHAPQFLSV
jgi:hypothetical protein